MLTEITTFISEQFGSNEFLQGGFILALVGTIAVWCKDVPIKIWDLFKRIMIIEGDVQKEDPAFQAIVLWLAEQPYGRRVKRFTVFTDEDTEDEPKVVLYPSPGMHWIWFEKRLVLITRIRDKIGSEDAMFRGFHESFTFRTFGKGRGIIERLITEAVTFQYEKEQGNTRVQLHDGYGNWNNLCELPKRPMVSVVLANNLSSEILRDMKWFLESESWYSSVGVPYRRGYLFYGLPGTGKTSLALALAGHFSLNLSIVSLSSNALDDCKLARMLGNAGKRSIFLLEDVDCLYDESRETKDKTGVTLSGLLNVLDGAQAQIGRVVILTTNHIDKLDSALIRPGRADLKIEFKLATPAQAEGLYRRFFPTDNDEQVSEFVAQMGDGKVSTAQIQGLLMKKVEAKTQKGPEPRVSETPGP